MQAIGKLVKKKAQVKMGLQGGDASDFELLLPDDWSDTDQRIFECLLLAQPPETAAVSDAQSAATARGANKNERKAAAAAGTHRKKAAAQESSTAATDKNEKPPRRQQQQQLSQEKDDADKSALKKRKAARRRTSLDERKFKHREVQRRFMERKKVRNLFKNPSICNQEQNIRLLVLVRWWLTYVCVASATPMH